MTCCMLVSLILTLSACDPKTLKLPSAAEESLDTFDSNAAGNSASKLALKRKPGNASEYDEVYEKNLFNSDREFIESEEEAETVEPTATPQRTAVDLPHVVLVGTLTASGNKHIAFIKNSKDKDKSKRNKTLKYEIGDWLGDYMLSNIEPDKVTLTKGEELAYLRLKPPTNISRKGRSRNRSNQQSNRKNTRTSRGETRSSSSKGKSSTKRGSTNKRTAANARDRTRKMSEDELKRLKEMDEKKEREASRACGSRSRQRSSSRRTRSIPSSCGR